MAVDKETLEYYLVQIRRIEEHREQGANQKIRQLSRQLVKDLREFLGVEYARLAEDDRLTYAILQQKGEYARFLEEVERKINNITPKVAEEIRNVVNDTYTAAYNGMVKAVEASTGRASLHESLKGLPLVSPEVIKRAVENPLSGLTLKDTLEKNRKEVIYDIKREIGIGLTQGDRMSTMAKRITDRVDMDYRKAMKIARTEVHGVREAGHYDSAVDISAALDKGSSGMVMVKIWRTMKDESVRPQREAYRRKSGVAARKKKTVGLRSYIGGPNHVKLEGVTVKVDEPFDLGGGVTATAPGQSGVAGHDINCRCFVEYDLFTVEEYEKATGKSYENPLTNVVDGGMIEVDAGEDDSTTVVTKHVDLTDERAVKAVLDDFESEYKDQLTETTLVLNQKGNDGNLKPAVNRYANMTADEKKTEINNKAISKIESYVVKNWGVGSVDLKGLDAHAISRTFKEMNKVFEEFPILKGSIREILQVKGADTLMATNFTGTLVINPKYYKDINIIKKGYAEDAKSGHFPKGTSWTNVAVHELGHRLNAEVIKRTFKTENARLKDWSNDGLATKVVNQALKTVKQEYQIKGMKKKELLSTISGYAIQNDSESLAEAFSDYYSNRNNANPISKEVMKILKEMLT